MRADRAKSCVWRPIACVVVAAATACFSCTTYIDPETCHGGEFKCNERSDVKFCEYVADTLEGAGCRELGLVTSGHFCVVTPASCIDTQYEVKNGDCKVARYTVLREWAECSPGTPTFVIRE
jgi:hypothetical protein